MPVMPRMNKKVRDIAYSILGKPQNDPRPNKRMRRIDRIIISQNTRYDYGRI